MTYDCDTRKMRDTGMTNDSAEVNFTFQKCAVCVQQMDRTYVDIARDVDVSDGEGADVACVTWKNGKTPLASTAPGRAL